MRFAGVFAVALFPAAVMAQNAKVAKAATPPVPTITIHVGCDTANHSVTLSVDPWDLHVADSVAFVWEVPTPDPLITVSVSPKKPGNGGPQWPWAGNGGPVPHGHGKGLGSGKPNQSHSPLGTYHYAVHVTCLMSYPTPGQQSNVTMNIDPDVTIDVISPQGKKPGPAKSAPRKPDA